MPTRRQLIQKITLNADTSSITFSNIPQNYTDIKIVSSARCSRSSIVSDLAVAFNGSTSNFTGRSLYGDGASAASNSAATRMFGVMNGATSTANTFGNAEVYVPNYAGSSNKSFLVKGAQETNASTAYISQIAGLWSSTAAITSITLSDLNSSNLVSGSTFYLYGITHVPIIRGGEVSISGGYKIHTFRSSGSIQVIEPGDVEYLVVAGGGSGGGQYEGGGGGGGGVLTGRSRLNAGIQTLTIGAGGAPAAQSTDGGNNGSNTAAFGITTTGGGRGGRFSSVAGASGGSGGGGGGPSGGGGGGTTGQGSSGGNGSTQAGGGGGGANAAGSNASSNTGGAGGAGRLWANNYYAGGGGGGATTTPGAGGIGGGGGGANYTVGAVSGTANTGGGGGGIRENVGITAGAGGSGIVIIRYPYDGN